MMLFVLSGLFDIFIQTRNEYESKMLVLLLVKSNQTLECL